MAMLAITGLQGSGKSHQAMKYIIVPNFAQGRTIRTNIKGINVEALIEYCKKEYPNSHPQDFGEIVIITDHDINKTNFYPILEEIDNKEVINDTNSVVKAGDVIVIDEAAQFYTSISEAVLVYFTMHRHFTDKNNLASEICLLVQDVGLLNSKVRKLLKNTYHCKKMDALGFSNRYFLGIYDGGTLRKNYMINSKNEPYDKEIFKLYASHAAGNGKEKKLDRRANIFASPKAWILIAAVVIAPIFLVYTLWRFVHPEEKNIKATDKNGTTSLSSTPVQPVDPTQSNYRIVGVVDFQGKRLVFLQDQFKNIKNIYPQSCTGKGILMTCKYENKEISYQGQNHEQKNNLPPVINNAISK